MKVLFEHDNQKMYFPIPVEKTESLRAERGKPIKIPDCAKDSFDMICFNPDSSILMKVNSCSCSNCLEGNFLVCAIEDGSV